MPVLSDVIFSYRKEMRVCQSDCNLNRLPKFWTSTGLTPGSHPNL